MSGIAGIYYLDGRSVDREAVVTMSDTLAHRGSDGSGVWVEGSIGLGHRLLWTTPESLLEKLPLVGHTGNVITADARIDNRDELALVLDLPDCPLEKITDSEFILAAYDKWGEHCPEHLLGDFAFAIWDRHQQRLFCARDHMGIKPFYYYQTDQAFVFGSELKAILCLPEVPRQLNKVKVADYLAVMLEDKSSTFYKGIFRLPPASCMTVCSDQIQMQVYWTLDPTYELHLGSDEEYAESLRNIFTEAVRCRLRSAFPVGAHLSGGLDSSSITCTARQLLQPENRPLHTFSDIFDHVPQCDERPFIQAVLDQGGLIPHFVEGTQIGPLSHLDQIFRYQDEAFFGPTHFQIWTSNQAVQREGVRVVLDGFDGDTTLSHGEGYLRALAHNGQWDIFAQQADEISKLVGVSPITVLRQYGLDALEERSRQFRWVAFAQETADICKRFKVSWQHIVLQHGIKPLIPQFLQQWRKKLHGKQPLSNRNWFFNRNFLQEIGWAKRIQEFSPDPSKLHTSERADHWCGITSGLVTAAMEVLDRSAAAFSLEARHPFMDKRLLEFCLSLPPEQKLNQGWSRFVMRRAMANILPEQVQWRRSKTNIFPTFLYGLLERDRAVLDEVMQNHLENVQAYVDTKALYAAYEQLISTDNLNSIDSSLALSPWRATLLSLWLRHVQLDS